VHPVLNVEFVAVMRRPCASAAKFCCNKICVLLVGPALSIFFVPEPACPNSGSLDANDSAQIPWSPEVSHVFLQTISPVEQAQYLEQERHQQRHCHFLGRRRSSPILHV
jgi:hypothetical protein